MRTRTTTAPGGSGGHRCGVGSGGFLDGLSEGIALLVVLIGFAAPAALVTLGWFALVPLLLLVADVVVGRLAAEARLQAAATVRAPRRPS